jgi:hypothetical protein
MIPRACHRQTFARAAAAALLVFGAGLAGCADMSEGMMTAFADPAKYDLYDCKQLETERKNLAARQTDLQGLMTKAETGVAGPVVAELAYRNDYIAVRAQAKLADEVWQRDKCRPSPPAAAASTAAPAVGVAPAANVRGGQAPSRSGSAVY